MRSGENDNLKSLSSLLEEFEKARPYIDSGVHLIGEFTGAQFKQDIIACAFDIIDAVNHCLIHVKHEQLRLAQASLRESHFGEGFRSLNIG